MVRGGWERGALNSPAPMSKTEDAWADAWQDVLADADLGEGQMRGVDVGDERVLLARVGGRVCALGGICTHQIAYLEDGQLEGDRVHCPRHGAAFDVHTGEPLFPPADMPVPVYDVMVVDGRIRVSCQPRRA